MRLHPVQHSMYHYSRSWFCLFGTKLYNCSRCNHTLRARNENSLQKCLIGCRLVLCWPSGDGSESARSSESACLRMYSTEPGPNAGVAAVNALVATARRPAGTLAWSSA